MMIVSELPELIVAGRRARARREIAELDYRRMLREMAETGLSQREIAGAMGIKQPSVNSALKTAMRVSRPVEGLSGATPWEICQRYAAGLVSRERVVEDLVAFPYAPAGEVGEVDSLIVDPPGSWDEVVQAVDLGLVEEEVYEVVFNLRHALSEEKRESDRAAIREWAAEHGYRVAATERSHAS